MAVTLYSGSPAQLPDILVLDTLPYVALMALSVYAFILFHQKKILEVRFDACQTQYSQTLAEKDGQLSSLRAENGALRARAQSLKLKLEKKVEVETEVVKAKRLDLEKRLMKEKDDFRKGYELTISRLTSEIAGYKKQGHNRRSDGGSGDVDVEKFKAIVRQKEALINEKDNELVLSQSEKSKLARMLEGKDDEVMQLRDKLSECYHRLQTRSTEGSDIRMDLALSKPNRARREQSSSTRQHYSEEAPPYAIGWH